MLMPFQEQLKEVYEHGIKPPVEKIGMQCKRADEIYTVGGILSDIWDFIQQAEIIIADCTGKNPNVMYELGLCHVLWKKVILLSQSLDDVPFDLRGWRVIPYNPSSFTGASKLKEDITRAIEALRQENVMESQPVALSDRVSSESEHAEHESNDWLHGTIETWRTERPYGFIKSGDETYWFNLDYCFSAQMIPTEGAKVVFKPLPPLPKAKNKRASDVFIEGNKLHGQINRILRGKGCAFANVHRNGLEPYSIYLETGDNSSLAVGDTVEFMTGSNKGGPTGTQVKIVLPA